jgi:hypothetical protein
MCNDLGNNVSYSEYLTAFSHTRIRVKWPAAAPNPAGRCLVPASGQCDGINRYILCPPLSAESGSRERV